MDSKNLDGYGAELIPWTRVVPQLESGETRGTYWLATTRPDGRPHVAGIGAVFVDGTFYFVSGPGTRKSRNLAENPSCVLSVSLSDIDVAVEGTAAIVRDPDTLERLAAHYRAAGWPAEAAGGALTAPFSAPSAGPAPWDLYEMRAVTAIGVSTVEQPGGATRWRFTSA